MSSDQEDNFFGDPIYTSTPGNSLTGVGQGEVNFTPFGKPRFYRVPGTRSSKFVTARRKVRFSPPEEEEAFHFNMSQHEEEDERRREEDSRNGGGEEEDEIEWDDEKLKQAKECYKVNKDLERQLKELHEARMNMDRERQVQLAEAEKIKLIEAQMIQRRLQLEDIERQLKEQAEQVIPKRVMGARKSGGPTRTPINPHVNPRTSIPQNNIIGTGGSGQVMSLNYIQQPSLTAFEAERGDDPRIFLDKYEKITSTHSDRARVDGFGNYLKGSALDWITVLEKERRSQIDFDESGVASNEWYELKWETLRELFETEFAENRAKEIFRTNQAAGEAGLTYYYKMLKLHQQSGLDMDEEQLATLIIQHMNENYKDHFEFRNYDTLGKLKEDLKRIDAKRKLELGNRAKEKRKANIALLELEADQHLAKKPKVTVTENNELKELTAKINAIQQQIQAQAQTPTSSNNNAERHNAPRSQNYQGVNRNRNYGSGQRGQNSQGYNNQKNRNGPKRDGVCYNCQIYGHFAHECRRPQNQQRSRAGNNRTYNSNRSGQQSNRNRQNRYFNRTDNPVDPNSANAEKQGNSERPRKQETS